MRTKIIIGFSALAWVWLLATVVQAQQPTSRVIPFNNVATTIAGPAPGQALTIELWDAATTPPGTLQFSEAQTLDVDATGAISFVFGSQTVGGLIPGNFPSGESRFLDVVDSTGASVLPPASGRIALNAVAFALSPGPQGPQGVPGQQGPPGVVQAVSAGDASIIVGGTAANPTVAVAANGITNANVANGALSPAKIAGTAATLGPNTFTGTQAVNGDLSATGNLTMVNSTATAGNILKGGVRFIHNFGFNNTFIGSNAGNLTMSGLGGNTASGSSALFSNTTGFFNTASGSGALSSNTFGSFNTASGFSALVSNTAGNGNTASGANALISNTTGSGNTASGVNALRFNTTGSGNTASGSSALLSNATGSNNTAVGALADVSVGNLTNATAIGAGAVVSASNALVLGGTGASAVNVGIGLQSPTFRLHVIDPASTGLRVQTNTAGGTVASFGGFGEFQVDAPGVVGGRLIIRETGLPGFGLVGINTNAPDNTLTVNGTADKPGGGAWATFSDGRLKTVQGAFRAGMEQILQLHPIRYRYKEQNALGIKDHEEHIGLVAQEVQKVIPEAVNADAEGYLLLNSDPILWAMLNAIKQQQTQIQEQAAQIAELHVRLKQTVEASKAENAYLKARLEKLERSIRSHAFAAKAE